jgi:hypothetical protein
MRPPIRVTVLAAVLLLAACSAEEPSPNEARSQSLRGDGDEAEPDFDPQRERAIKKAWQQQMATTQVDKVDWSKVDDYPSLDSQWLAAEALDILDGSPVPALLPGRPELLESATITRGEHWYAASLDGEGHDVYVSGTRLSVKSATIDSEELPERPEGEVRLTRNEAIVSAAFEAFGASYVVEVECARPMDDPRCTEDDYAQGLVDDLGVVARGGKR